MSFAEVAVMVTIRAAPVGFGFGAMNDTFWPLVEVGGETCPHKAVAEQDTAQLTPLESFVTVALMEAAPPPSMVCGEGCDTLTEIGGALPPQPASTAARRSATPREGPRSIPGIKPPDEMQK